MIIRAKIGEQKIWGGFLALPKMGSGGDFSKSPPELKSPPEIDAMPPLTSPPFFFQTFGVSQMKNQKIMKK